MVRALPLSREGARASGVTLLEILVAVAVLAVGLSTIFQIFPMGFAASAKSSAQTTAYELAARKLEDVRNNHLFGGIPNAANPLSNDWYKYWGNRNAPNPDDAAYVAVNTDGAFRAFPGNLVPERSYFYRVHCIPVVDPPRPRTSIDLLPPPKYLEFPHIVDPDVDVATYPDEAWKAEWRGFASMYRVTVTVRGPLKTLAEAQDDQWQNSLAQKGAVEVKLVTYVANKKLGDALLAVDSTCTAENNASYGPDNKCKPVRDGELGTVVGGRSTATPAPGAWFVHIVGLDGGYPFPENFTVLHGLTDLEVEDAGPTVVLSDSGPPEDRTTFLNEEYFQDESSPGETYPRRMQGAGLNRAGMDNVLIVYQVSPGKFIAESNKVIAIHPPGTLTDGYSGNNQLWRLDLLNPLIASDGDYTDRHLSGDNTFGYASELADRSWDSDSHLTRGGTGKYGYPASSQNNPRTDGTRVRFLMRLEKWPR